MRPLYYVGFVTIVIYGIYFHIYGGDIAFGGDTTDTIQTMTPAQELSYRINKPKTSPEQSSEIPVDRHGVYVDYSPTKVAEAPPTKKIVLFFIAYWCPSCASADKSFTQHTALIPSDVIIMKVNFDKATDLREKYGVTSQHTYVQIDNKGNEVQRWNGGSLATLKAMVY